MLISWHRWLPLLQGVSRSSRPMHCVGHTAESSCSADARSQGEWQGWAQAWGLGGGGPDARASGHGKQHCISSQDYGGRGRGLLLGGGKLPGGRQGCGQKLGSGWHEGNYQGQDSVQHLVVSSMAFTALATMTACHSKASICFFSRARSFHLGLMPVPLFFALVLCNHTRHILCLSSLPPGDISHPSILPGDVLHPPSFKVPGAPQS